MKRPTNIHIRYTKDYPAELGYIGDKKSDWIDLYTAETVTLQAGEYTLISLGVAMQLPDGVEANIVPRSSTFKNYGVLQANSIGVIDNTYCGDNDIWKFPAYATRDITIPKGTRICQFRLHYTMRTEFGGIKFEPVISLGNADRGGFGSSGK